MLQLMYTGAHCVFLSSKRTWCISQNRIPLTCDCTLLQAAGIYNVYGTQVHCAAVCRELGEEAVNSIPKLDAYPFLKSAMLQAVADAVMERTRLASEDVSQVALWSHYALTAQHQPWHKCMKHYSACAAMSDGASHMLPELQTVHMTMESLSSSLHLLV